MQRMQPDERQQAEIPPYQGYQSVNDRGTSDRASAQKVADEDEQFADILVRKIKQDLKDELNSGHEDKSIGYRVALAIVSVVALVPIFIVLIAILAHGIATGATIGIVWAMIAVCATILFINVSFNASAKR